MDFMAIDLMATGFVGAGFSAASPALAFIRITTTTTTVTTASPRYGIIAPILPGITLM
jgi:hypothetical protein